MVAIHEKGVHDLVLTAETQSSHGSLTSGTKATPTERMAAFITEVCKKPPFIRRLNPQMKAMFTALAPYCSFPMQVLFSNLWLFGGLLTALLPKISPQAGGMIGSSCVFNKIQGESVKNSCTCTALLRSVDGGDMEKDLAVFHAIAKKYDIQVQADPTAAYFEPADMTRPAFAYTMDRIAHHFPDAPAAPMILTAGSDARYMAEVCPCVLRFTPIRLSKAQLSSVHAKDENIDLSTVAEAVAFYKDYVASYK
jgi:carboxypeptidase PM20D1